MAGPRERVYMSALPRPDPALPDHDWWRVPPPPPDPAPYQPAATRVEPLTRGDLEVAIGRVVRAVYLSALLFAAAVLSTAWWLRR
jgi:hypothetical protein